MLRQALFQSLYRPCRSLAVLVVCTAAVLSIPVRAVAVASQNIAIVLTPHESYRAASTTIKAELIQAGHSCVTVELPYPQQTTTQPAESQPTSAPLTPTQKALAKLVNAKPEIIVTAGTRATQLVLATVPDTPVVFCMIPNVLDIPALVGDQKIRQRLTGVTTDISPREYTRWIHKLHPHIHNIGVLHSDHGKRTVEAIASAAQKQGFRILPIEAHKAEFLKAIEELAARQCEAVLMIPDARVYNSANVQRLLLWGLRQKKPVWAFSANIVKAGAFAGLYSDSDDIGQQVAQTVQKILTGTKVSTLKLQYPQVVHSAINERTADKVGLSLSSSVLDSISVRYGKQE